MEVELKYLLPQWDVIEQILEDENLTKYEEHDTRRNDEMRARYYDTEDHVLQDNKIAFRVRKEGEKLVATLKWSGCAEGPLHIREEYNVLIHDMDENPNLQVFSEAEVGKNLLALVGDKPLVKVMDIDFLRKSFRIDYKSTLIEVSVDEGQIVTEMGTEPILELELELFSGDEEKLMEVGNLLMKKYNIVPEVESKYARGLNILGRVKNKGDIK